MPRARKKCKRDLPLVSAEKIAHHEDLLIEILRRLPAKPLHKFKVVCKHWRILISSSYFSHLWNPSLKTSGIFLSYPRSSRRPMFFYVDERRTQLRPRSPFCGFSLGKFIIAQSCNGLILCVPENSERFVIRKCYICNPTTKQCLKIDVPGLVSASFFAMAFDPKKSQTYHVIAVKRLSQQIYVYSSETRSWSVLLSNVVHMGMNRVSRTYWNGAIYWSNLRSDYAICFEIERQVVKYFSLPSYESVIGRIARRDSYEYCCFGVCDDHLCLIQKFNKAEVVGTQGFAIFYLEKGLSSEWTTKCYVKHTDMMKCIARESGSVIPNKVNFLSIICQEEDKELAVVVSIPGAVVSYCPKTHTAKILHRVAGERRFKAHQHIEALYAIQ